MIGNIDYTLVDWSRAQFALTAIYHWLFVPLTLGLSIIIAIMESIYVRTGDPLWRKVTKFWMTLFGINFAIGIATGIILEFEFGTNWSNYSWFVGDIFGAPLAVEGIMAFFLESTFVAVMFFGWNKVSKKYHLASTWLVAAGASISALWILVANAWMQNPVGMHFNPDTARNEMVDFWAVLFSHTAINKFLHTVTSGGVLAAVFVIGISAWYMLHKREMLFAKKSMLVASVFGLIMGAFLLFTGDGSAREIAKVQPMKFAAMEGLYDGKRNAPLVAIGMFAQPMDPYDPEEEKFSVKFEIPSMLSYMAFLDPNAFVPGISDLIQGNEDEGLLSSIQKIEKGKVAIQTLKDFKQAVDNNDYEKSVSIRAKFNDPAFIDNYFRYFGYGYYENPVDLIPSVPVSFFAFRIMVILGIHFMILFLIVLILLFKDKLHQKRWILFVALFTVPLVYIASMAGWILAEFGRQPWVIQDMLPTIAAVSHIESSSVQITFWMFAILFTTLLIAEIRIMTGQIRKGPKNEGDL
jgi:cytochrome d ubiquinol oxidase subunit I